MGGSEKETTNHTNWRADRRLKSWPRRASG